MVIKRKTLENGVIIFLAFLIIISLAKDSVPADGADVNEGYDVPIIMYHAIMKDPARSGDYVITPDMLRKDVEYILDNGYTPVFMTDIIDFVNGNGELPEKPIVITFDDGYYNNYLYAYPITKEYNIKAVISIIGKHTVISEGEEKLYEAFSHVTWDQLREMSQSGLWEVQNHTYDMHEIKGKNGLLAVDGKSPEERNSRIQNDIQKLQELIKENVGNTPNTFTYPFGSYDKSAVSLIREMGFQAGLSCEEGINKIFKGCNLELLYRYNRPASLSTEEFYKTILNK